MICDTCNGKFDEKLCCSCPQRMAKGGIVSNETILRTVGGDIPEKIVPLKDMTIRLTPEMLAKAAANIGITTYRKDTVKGRIIDMLNKQTEKGLEKYGHTLDDCPDSKFDWRLMVIEELVDALQYQQKEIMRLERLLNPSDT